MQFAYSPAMCDPEFYLPLAIEAEKCGYTSFTVPDSICYPQNSDSKYPYNDDGSREFLDGVPFLEPFTIVPAMAAVTTELRFTTSVMKLAIRQPVIVAKQLASVGVITKNRFAFGVGISPWPEDFAVAQIPWEKRGKRMDEMMEIVNGLMTGEYFGYDGEIFQLDPIKICPVPTKPVPLLIGGHTKPALRRAARLADGFIHSGGGADEFAPVIAEINHYRKEYGRDHLPFEYQAMSGDAFSPDGVKKLEDLGVHECVVAFRDPYKGDPDTSTLDEKIGQMRWFSDAIISKVD